MALLGRLLTVVNRRHLSRSSQDRTLLLSSFHPSFFKQFLKLVKLELNQRYCQLSMTHFCQAIDDWLSKASNILLKYSLLPISVRLPPNSVQPTPIPIIIPANSQHSTPCSDRATSCGPSVPSTGLPGLAAVIFTSRSLGSEYATLPSHLQ